MPPDVELRAPRLVRPLQWRWHASRAHVEMLDEPTGRWFGFLPWTADVFEGLAVARPFAEQVDRLVASHDGAVARADADLMLRRLLYGLWQTGLVDLDLPAAPRVFAGRYEVEAELGRGGTGVAWRCRDAKTGARVVVKHGWGFFVDPAVADASVRDEARVTREFDHPLIARALDGFEEDGRFHLVRELVDGEPLSRAVVAPDDVVPIASKIARILAHVHERGFLLLDVNPPNFLLSRDGPVLIDAGLARRAEGGIVRLDGPVGSRGFVAPEVRATNVADVRSEVWALGRVAFAACTRIMPIAAWGEDALAKELGDHVARPFVLALAKDDPAARPPDMRAVLDLTRSRPGAS